MGIIAPNSSYAGTRGSILIVDDSGVWRTCVRELLEKQPELQIVGEACDGSEAVHLTKELLPDVVILDIGMPVLNGIEAAKRIRQDSPASKVIFATQNDDADIKVEALATGAERYLLKVNAASERLAAVEAALNSPS